NRVVTAYDPNSNPVAVASVEVSEGGLVGTETFVTRYVYDQLDRLVRATDNAGQTSYFSYDSRDNLVVRADPEGTPTSDPLGIFPGPINQPGNTCTYVYDGLDRLIRQVCDLRVGGTGAGALDTSNPTNPDGQVTLGFAFDGNSRLVARTDDNGNTTSWSYDALDRALRETNADGTFYEFTYDKDDNVRRVKDPAGSIVTKTYDALNRLLQVDVLRAAGVAGTTQETFAYDGLSRLTQATDDNGAPAATQTVAYVYDSLGRVLEEQQNGQPVSSVYTGDGKRLRVTYPGGRVIGHTFDALDRIRLIEDQTQLTGRTLAFSDWVGPGYRELRRIYGNGTKLSFLGDFDVGDVGYDAVQRITRLRHFLPG